MSSASVPAARAFFSLVVIPLGMGIFGGSSDCPLTPAAVPGTGAFLLERVLLDSRWGVGDLASPGRDSSDVLFRAFLEGVMEDFLSGPMAGPAPPPLAGPSPSNHQLRRRLYKRRHRPDLSPGDLKMAHCPKVMGDQGGPLFGGNSTHAGRIFRGHRPQAFADLTLVLYHIDCQMSSGSHRA